MAGKAFDREILNVRERPLSPDLNALQSQLDRTLRDVLKSTFATQAVPGGGIGAPFSGCVGDGLMVVPNSPMAMSVVVRSGVGFVDNPGDAPSAIGGIGGLDDLSTYKPLYLSTDEVIAIDAAPGVGQSRIDIIEVKVSDRRAENPTNRDILNEITGLFTSGLVNKTLAFDLSGRSARVVSPASSTTGIGYKVGVAGVTGAEAVPATTAGYVKIAEVRVAAGDVSLDWVNLADMRAIIGPGGGGSFDINALLTVTRVNANQSSVTIDAAGMPAGVRLAVAGASSAGSGTGLVHDLAIVPGGKAKGAMPAMPFGPALVDFSLAGVPANVMPPAHLLYRSPAPGRSLATVTTETATFAGLSTSRNSKLISISGFGGYAFDGVLATPALALFSAGADADFVQLLYRIHIMQDPMVIGA